VLDQRTATVSGAVLWAGTVRTATLRDRVAAATAAGYAAISLSTLDYRRARSSGLADGDIRRMVVDAGLEVACLDPFTRWLPTWDPPPGFPAQLLDLLGAEEGEFLRAAVAVGATSMTVLEPFGTRWPEDVAARSLALIARRAGDAGVRVNLEFIPFLGIPDLATAWRIVQASGVSSAGIVLDTWHYFRGAPDDELLATIPGDRIGAVQVCDAAREPRGGLETDCLHHRLPAGDGEFPLERVLHVLSKTGGLNRVGPEIFSDAFDARPAVVNARHALQGLEPWLAASAAQTPRERGGKP
jgi:sugar phosphate isomerase/epimerase